MTLHLSPDEHPPEKYNSPLRSEHERRNLGKTGTAPSLGLYETHTGGAENKRLKDMAEKFGDRASLDALHKLGVYQGDVVLDVGCGNSTSLAQKMDALGLTVVPTDIRPDAVVAHRLAGFPNARESSANCLMVGDNTINASHARFTWGWLSSKEQKESLAEMLRVGKKDTGVVIIDYDWSACSGPKEFMDSVKVITDVLAQQGFDPDFGKKLPLKFGEYLREVCVDPVQDAQVTMRRSTTYDGAISEALEDIVTTAQPLIDGLAKIGRDGEIKAELEKLRHFIAGNPDASVRLPDIVSVTARITKSDSSLTKEYFELGKISTLRRAVSTPSPKPYESGVDFEYVWAKEGVGVEERKSGLVKEEGLRNKLRKTQAFTYLDAGHITREAITPDGFFVETIDPQELVDRSDYFVRLDDSYSRIRAQARSIKTNENGAESLPFVQRVLEHSPELRDLLMAEGILDPTKKVIEVSGLAKNPIGGSFLDVIEVLIDLSRYNEQNGVDIAVMSIDKKQAGLMQRLFGENNLRQLGGNDHIHGLGLPGVNDELRFVPLVTNNEFLQNAKKHLKGLIEGAGDNKRLTRLYEDVLSLM